MTLLSPKVMLFAISIVLVANVLRGRLRDVVIGLGSLIGVRSPENFDKPFLATNISESWLKVHRTLTLWLTDWFFAYLSGEPYDSGAQFAKMGDVRARFRVADLGEDEKNAFLNLCRLLPAEEFYDIIHLTPSGATKLTESVSEFLQAQRLQEPK